VRLAIAGSTARRIPSLRSGSRGVRLRLTAQGGRFATGAANFLNEGRAPGDFARRELLLDPGNQALVPNSVPGGLGFRKFSAPGTSGTTNTPG